MSDKKNSSQGMFEESEGFKSLLTNHAPFVVDDDDKMLEMTGSSMLLHNIVESINPVSLMELLTSITNAELEIGLEERGTTVKMSTLDGNIVFSNIDDLANWKSVEPDESLLIEAAFRFTFPMYLDPKIQANVNRELLFGRVVVDEDDDVEFRATINLRGGRSVENILWDILGFSKEVVAVKNSLYQ
jgi:hypothetical protein